MDMRTPRARVKGWGSAKAGTGHFISQRMSAIALAVLAPFFLVTFAGALGLPWAEAAGVYRSPFNAIVAALFLAAAFYHLSLGLQVVIEDYVHSPGLRTGSLIAVKLGAAILGFASVFAVAMLAFSV